MDGFVLVMNVGVYNYLILNPDNQIVVGF